MLNRYCGVISKENEWQDITGNDNIVNVDQNMIRLYDNHYYRIDNNDCQYDEPISMIVNTMSLYQWVC